MASGNLVFVTVTIAIILALLMPVECEKDFYELLGISREATVREIRKAFKKIALTEHPDKKQVKHYMCVNMMCQYLIQLEVIISNVNIRLIEKSSGRNNMQMKSTGILKFNNNTYHCNY